MRNLDGAIAGVARSGSLLVAADFDGTLSRIVDEPGMAIPEEESFEALRGLATLPNTHAAIISGRSLADLRARLGEFARIHLIGSHGGECSSGPSAAPSQANLLLLAEARGFMEELVARTPGALVERKPVGCAFHYRKASERDAAEAVRQLLAAAGGWSGLHLRQGKKVIELSAVRADKGEAVTSLRTHLGVGSVLYIGDDVTDEDVFHRLLPSDVGVKVGPGSTAAKYRVPDTQGVGDVLNDLLKQRRSVLC